MGEFAPLIISGASQISGGIAEAGAIRAEAEYRQRIAEVNVSLSNLQAEDALARGQEAVALERQRTKQLIGEQRVAAAAQGIDPGFGSPVELRLGTADVGASNIMKLRTNAFRQAFGFRVEAAEQRAAGRFAKISGRFAARTSLITGGLKAARAITGGTIQLQTRQQIAGLEKSQAALQKEINALRASKGKG